MVSFAYVDYAACEILKNSVLYRHRVAPHYSTFESLPPSSGWNPTMCSSWLSRCKHLWSNSETTSPISCWDESLTERYNYFRLHQPHTSALVCTNHLCVLKVRSLETPQRRDPLHCFPWGSDVIVCLINWLCSRTQRRPSLRWTHLYCLLGIHFQWIKRRFNKLPVR